MSNKLLNWLSSECGESFADDLSTDMQTLVYQTPPDAAHGMTEGLAYKDKRIESLSPRR